MRKIYRSPRPLLDRFFRFADRRVRVVIGVLAVSLAVGNAAPPWIDRAYDIFGWSRVSIVRKLDIFCDLATGNCLAKIEIKKLLSGCDTLRVYFAGYAEGVDYSGEFAGEPRDIAKTDGRFVNLEVPYRLYANLAQLPTGKFVVDEGGIEYRCNGRRQTTQFPRFTGTFDGIDYKATTVTFYRSTTDELEAQQ